MIKGHDIPNDRLYENDHIRTVLSDLVDSFPKYLGEFSPNKNVLALKLRRAENEFQDEQTRYLELLDRGYLEEFEYDPSAFKSTLRKDCPIIRRCLNSQAKVMDAYRASFNRTSSETMLKVVKQISEYGSKFISTFDANQQLCVTHPNQLGISELDTEPYTAYGVIGGGIRSHFLYNLYPMAFPNRGQNAIWALYFLSGRKKYDFEDDSEFLMINPDGTGTQQNYFYPYDLFIFYAVKLFLLLRTACQSHRIYLDEEYRYVYLNSFMDFVADRNRSDIDCLKPQYEDNDY